MMNIDMHIVFGDSASGSLKQALRELGIDDENKVITFSDLFSIGPVWKLHDEMGRVKRAEWLKRHLPYGPYDDNEEEEYVEQFRKALHKINGIPPTASIAIWIGENAHEQTAFRFVLHLLKERKNNIFSINASQAYKERFKRFMPRHLGEINPEQIILFMKNPALFQPLSDNERQKLEKQWDSLAESDAVLRIWNDGEIKSVEENYFDEHLIRTAEKLHKKRETRGFIKAPRIIGEVLGHSDQYVGDQYLEFRLRHLIQTGVFAMEGSLEAMRFYSVQLNEK